MRQPRPGDVLDAVCEVTGVDPMRSDRKTATVKARTLAVQALTMICGLSSTEIAGVLGYRDHSGVLYHQYKAHNWQALTQVIDRVSAQLESEQDAKVVVQQ